MAVGSFKHPIRTGIACATIGTSFSWVGPVKEKKKREYGKRVSKKEEREGGREEEGNMGRED